MTSRLAVRIGSQRPRLQHLPPGRASSAGADAVEFAATCGLILDDWQQWCLDHLLAEDRNGQWCAQQAALVLPRQNGKNAVLEALELYAFYVLDEPTILHTAHRAKTSADHMKRMKALVRRNPELNAITYPYESNGKEALERMDTGARLEFMTRGKGSVRGGSPTRLIFDEALFLTDAHINAIIPSMSAQSMNEENPPQFIYTSSAPLAESEVLHRIRQRGMSATAGRMFFAEWSCELGVGIDDRDAWYSCNPGMGIRISEQWVEDNELPPSLSEEGFLVERLGVVFPVGDQRDVKLPADKWAATATDKIPPDPKPGDSTLSFDVSKDAEWCSVAIAVGTREHPYVEVIRHQQRTEWLAGYLVEIYQKRKPSKVICNNAGPASAVIGTVHEAFEAAGISRDELHMLTASEYKQACGAFYVAVVEGKLSRPPNQGPLDLAAGDATERPLSGAWVWDARQATVPISPLVAVSIAPAFLPIEKAAEFWYA